MRSNSLFLVVLLILAVIAAACAGPSTGTPPAAKPTAVGSEAGPASSGPGNMLSAKEAVALAYAALPADWKPTAMLAFVGRYSQYCNVGCSPFVVEDDPGIAADGRQAHWVVIFAKDESASPANVFYVEEGKAKLVKSDVATIRPDELFALEGWVDSTEIRFRTSKPVGLELRTSDLFEDVDAELANYPLLWLAETSFARFDVYDARTGQFIKSR
ncbi:MAG: hypothetical protein ACUVSG_06505 [Anaerolineae bacterium]